MKEYHYYAKGNFEVFDAPQEEMIADSMLTREMVDWLLWKYCKNLNPVKLTVPRDIVYDLHVWISPLLDLRIVDGKSESENPEVRLHPCDVATMEFEDCKVFIHARRCVPSEISFCDNA